MSQDAPQPRSRRELRRAGQGDARDEASSATDYPAVKPLPRPEKEAQSRGHGGHASSAPVDSEPGDTGQIESGKIEGLRRRRRLAESGSASSAGAPGSADQTGSSDQASLEQAPERGEYPMTSVTAVPLAQAQQPAKPTSSPEGGNAPSSAAPSQQPVTERSSQVRARNRAALRTAEQQQGPVEYTTRRALRERMRAEQAPAEVAGGQAAGAQDADLDRDHQEFLAESQAHTQSMPRADNPDTVDPDVLAQQKELAERAKVINERAAQRAKLAQESEKSRSEQSDPTTAHNLAMVTPLQFVKMPGMQKPVMKPPATSHVPIITRAVPQAPARRIPSPAETSQGQQVAARGTQDKQGTQEVAPTAAPVPAAAPAQGASPSETLGSRARVLRRAELVANTRRTLSADDSDSLPLPANSAHGLEPLDAVTAGLGRAHRDRFWQWGIAVVGAAALVVGVVMIVFSMNR